MNNFFSNLVKNKSNVFLAFILIFCLGVYALTKLEIGAVPDITNKQVVINTKTGSYTSFQIEKIVTYPIESEMAGIPGVEEIRSLSKYGLSQVVIIFKDDTDIYFARQLVNERLQKVLSTLPKGITSELSPVTTGLGEILMWTLSLKAGSEQLKLSTKEQLQYLRRIQDYKIKPFLKRIQGVAEVDTNGGFNSEVHINYFPEKLNTYGLNISEVIHALENTGISYGGGYIQKKGNQVTVLATINVNEIADIKKLPLKKLPSGRVLLVSDIAEIRLDHSLRVGSATTMGKQTVIGTVLMLSGSNSSDVSSEVQENIKKLNLPDDVDLKIVYDRKYLVDQTIKTVEKNLLEGAALVIFILLLILGHIRAAIVVAFAIPASMLFASIGMWYFKVSANLMSLGAIDFGLLVDGSVVMVENFIRRLQLEKKSHTQKGKWSILIESSREISKPIIFGLLIIIIVYIPILFLEGVEGKMFKPMAITVVLALFGSLVVALFLTPLLAGLFIKLPSNQHHEPLLFKYILKAYEPILEVSLKYKKSILAASILTLLITIFTFSKMGSDFVPQLDEGDLVIGLVRDSKQSIEESTEQQMKAEKVIMTFAEVETVFSRMGTPESATDPMGPNFADTFVILKRDRSQWPKAENGKRRTKEELFVAIKQRLEEELPEQDISSTQPIEMRFNEILEGSRADVTMRIFGPDLEQLLEYINNAKEKLKDIKGVESIEFDALTGLTKSEVIEAVVSPEKAMEMGLTFDQVNTQISQSLSGQEVGYYFYDENMRIPIVFHLDESIRDDLDTIKSLPISHPDAGSVSLDDIADIEHKEQVTTIARSWAERYSALSFYIQGRDIASVVKEAQSIINENLKLKDEYRIEWGGQFKNLERAQKKLLIIIPLTLIIIFFLLYKMTHSMNQSLIIFTAIPFGLVGGVFALYLRDMNFSISAAVGFIALSGIVILNSLVLVSFVNDKYKETHDLLHSIKEGTKERLRPVVMTALVASFGFLPMAFGTGMGAEVQRPLATVVVGGLITSTILTMVVIPILLTFMNNKSLNKIVQKI